MNLAFTYQRIMDAASTLNAAITGVERERPRGPRASQSKETRRCRKHVGCRLLDRPRPPGRTLPESCRRYSRHERNAENEKT